MFDDVQFGVPVDWEPIPDSVLAELPPLDIDLPDAAVTPADDVLAMLR